MSLRLLLVLATALVALTSVIPGALAAHVSTGAPMAEPYGLTATRCSQAPQNPACAPYIARADAQWVVLLHWDLPSNGTAPAEYRLAANQSVGLASLTESSTPARLVYFPSNATNTVLLGTNLRKGWGLNPAQNWMFGLCAINASNPCSSWWASVTTTGLSAVLPGSIDPPTNLSARWSMCDRGCVNVSWSYRQGWISASFFRVGLLTGKVCLGTPTLAEWNTTSWRQHATPNGSQPSNARWYVYSGLNPALAHAPICAYVEAVNRSIGDGLNTIYPHGLPAADAVLLPGPLCLRCMD